MESMLWQIFQFGDHEVCVIEQWRDPFGRRMIRIRSLDENEERTEGMYEENFLRRAIDLDRKADFLCR